MGSGHSDFGPRSPPKPHPIFSGLILKTAQVYIRASPLPELPEALFLVLFALADGYSLNRRLCLLERLDRKAPDSVALTCGIATLLRQFHPCYGKVCAAWVFFAHHRQELPTHVRIMPMVDMTPVPSGGMLPHELVK